MINAGSLFKSYFSISALPSSESDSINSVFKTLNIGASEIISTACEALIHSLQSTVTAVSSTSGIILNSSRTCFSGLTSSFCSGRIESKTP